MRARAKKTQWDKNRPMIITHPRNRFGPTLSLGMIRR
jgi:hypothetical protein